MSLIFFLLIGFPIVEIYLLIKIGGMIGAFNTISLIIFTAITGIFYAKREGLNTLKSAIGQVVKNEVPLFEIMSGAALVIGAFLLILPGFLTDVSGAALAFAALLLIIPGFLSDTLGFILIIPFTRKLIIKNFLTKKVKKRFNNEDSSIEGEYEEIKDDKK